MGWWESNCIPCGSPEDITETQIKALTWLAFCQQKGVLPPNAHPTHIYFAKINLLTDCVQQLTCVRMLQTPAAMTDPQEQNIKILYNL